MAAEPRQSKNGPDNTLHPTPKVIWAILFTFTSLSILGLLVVIIIVIITKNPLLVAAGTTCITMPIGFLGSFCGRIINSQYKLSDREYIIHEIKAKRDIFKMRKHEDEDKTKTPVP